MCVWIDHNGVVFSIELLEWGRTFSDFLGYVLRHIGLKTSIYYFCGGGGGRMSFIDPICFSFLHGFAHVSKPGYQRDT